MSHDVSCALTYLVNKEGRSDQYLTTAWFIELINHWFELMTSRHPVLARKLNREKYDEAVDFLRGVIRVFESLKIGKGEWKPIQTGVILSTTSVLDIAEELLEAGHKFLLTSRLTQDCLENLFSVVRLKKPVPSPLEFKYALKMISTAQFLTLPRSGSYQQDDGEFLADFRNQGVRVPSEPQPQNIHLADDQHMQELPQAELDSLYHLAGYCIRSVKKNEKTCVTCMKAVTAGAEDETHPAAELSKLKEYREGCMVHTSKTAYDMILIVESMFRAEQASLTNKTDVKTLLVERAEQLTKDIDLPSCHNIKHKLISKFINARLHFFCKKINLERRKQLERTKKWCELGSKSMAMRKLAKNVK